MPLRCLTRYSRAPPLDSNPRPEPTPRPPSPPLATPHNLSPPLAHPHHPSPPLATPHHPSPPRYQEYYARKSAEWIEGDGTPAYMVKAEAALETERERVTAYLNSASEGKLLGVVETEVGRLVGARVGA